MSGEILVIGRSGQLAAALAGLAGERGLDLRCVGREACDLAAPEPVRELIAHARPALVINAAAYTAVDKAESEPDAAFALNRDGPAALAAACAGVGAPLVHVSTDYVYSGGKTEAYVETDPTGPMGIYGASKRAGEAAVQAAQPNSAILRTSWVYSAHGANFVKTMLRLAETREEVGVVADQHGRPTWAVDLAAACLAAGDGLRSGRAEARGVFHYAGAGDATWADLAEAVFAEAAAVGRKAARVKRITTADYPTPARRPANSRLDTTKWERTFPEAPPRPWREALSLCLRTLWAA